MIVTERSATAARVLHCSMALGGGGAERQLRNFLINGQADDIEHAVFAWRDGEFAAELKSRGVTVFLVPGRKSNPMSAIGSLSSVIRKWRPNLIQTWSPQFDVVAPIVARRTRVPVVGSERNSQFVYRDRAVHGRRWYSVLRPFAFRYGVEAVCANSAAGSRYLVDDLKVRVPVHTVPNGLDLDAIEAAAPVPLNSVGLPKTVNDPVILAASRLTVVKRVDVILSAMAILGRRGLHPYLLVCGSGVESPSLEQMAAELGLSGRVRFLGQRRDVVGIMKSADIFCTSSEGEGLPNSSLEAMACGLPVVASDIPPHRDLLDPAKGGRLFTSRSAESLADSLAELIEAPELRRELGASGQAYSANFQISRMCEQLNDVYRCIIRSRNSDGRGRRSPEFKRHDSVN